MEGVNRGLYGAENNMIRKLLNWLDSLLPKVSTGFCPMCDAPMECDVCEECGWY